VNTDQHQVCKTLIDKLTELAISCPDDDRRDDAKRTVCMLAVMFTSKDHPDHPGNLVPHIEGSVLRILASGLGEELPPDLRN
jgi:hypothetical protein